MAWSANWNHVGQFIGSQGIHVVDTVANHKLGSIVLAQHPDYGQGEFIYLKGASSTAVHNWVVYNLDDWTTTRLAADAIGPVAVAMAACDASTKYGWYQISGKTIGSCKTQFADDGIVFCTSTAGSVDDASVAGDLVSLARGASATTANTFIADFEIARPFVNDRTANK